MDFSAVGKKIKELRKQAGLSQGELAEGICTQAQISKIEKGDVYPYASTLYLISQKLGVDVNYFFDIGMTPRLDYVEEVFNQLKLARRNMNYEDIRDIVKVEEKNPLFLQNNKNYQILLWHKAIYEYEMKKNVDKALSLLDEAISLTKSSEKLYSEREIELLLTRGVFYFEEKRYAEALAAYKDALHHLKVLPFLNDKSIRARLFYNTARVLTRLLKYEESIQYCYDAIKWCLREDHLYLLAELHYQLGYNLELLGNYTEAKNYLSKALFLFELQKNYRFTAFIKQKLKSWEIEDQIHS
ncbi:helix-turn-helix domain-containing protein [Bacillus massiliglaciei]|uniref:helix-turn-helix domain-containing protein n=1 Tax=Bacillus massiliglaciei TaxID=1816693 RepID=UPI000A44FA0A|nr:helix-turn-helix domain-containing protein [Bacillus massiliglaciei]